MRAALPGAATLVMLGAAYLAYVVLVDWRSELAASVAVALALRRLLPRRMAGILFGGR